MPAWNDYKAHARERGALAFEVFVAVSTPTGKVPVPDVLPDHLAYVAKLEQEGAVLFSGPLSDETGEQMEGTGMQVLRAPDMDAARALADADPMHARGARSYTLRKWLINEGSLTVTVGLSGGRVALG